MQYVSGSLNSKAGVELETMPCPDETRRSLLLTALATGACLATKSVVAEEDQPGSNERPQKGDLLVPSEGDPSR